MSDQKQHRSPGIIELRDVRLSLGDYEALRRLPHVPGRAP